MFFILFSVHSTVRITDRNAVLLECRNTFHEHFYVKPLLHRWRASLNVRGRVIPAGHTLNNFRMSQILQETAVSFPPKFASQVAKQAE